MFQSSGEAMYPSLLDRCIYIMIAHQKGCHTATKNPPKYFPSTFRRDIGRRFVIPFDCISFVIQIPSARHHSCSTILFFQTCWRRTVSFMKTHGRFLYTLYDTHSCPGHYLRGPYGRNFVLPSVLSHYHQTLPLDLDRFGKSLRGGIEIPFKSSEYVILKCFSSSSFSTSNLPLFDSIKSF